MFLKKEEGRLCAAKRCKILELLETDSKLMLQQTSVMLGEDEAAVEKEIAALKEEGVILQYSTFINWERVQ